MEQAAHQGARLRLVGGLAAYRYAVDRTFAAREYSDIDVIGASAETARLSRAFVRAGFRGTATSPRRRPAVSSSSCRPPTSLGPADLLDHVDAGPETAFEKAAWIGPAKSAYRL